MNSLRTHSGSAHATRTLCHYYYRLVVRIAGSGTLEKALCFGQRGPQDTARAFLEAFRRRSLVNSSRRKRFHHLGVTPGNNLPWGMGLDQMRTNRTQAERLPRTDALSGRTRRGPMMEGLRQRLDISRTNPKVDMEATHKKSAPETIQTGGPDTRESIQRVLDQCVERGQLHRLYQWATKLNEMCHGEGQGGP